MIITNLVTIITSSVFDIFNWIIANLVFLIDLVNIFRDYFILFK